MDIRALIFSLGFILPTVTASEVCQRVDDYCGVWAENVDLYQLLEQYGGQCPASNDEEQLDPDTCLTTYGFDLPKPVNVTFTSRPQNRSVSGKSVTLKCATDPPAIYTYWYFNGQRITNKNNPVYQHVSITEGELDNQRQLYISTAGPDYYGEYTCEVTTANGMAQASAWISGPQHKACKLDFAVAPENIMVKRHGHATLHCDAKNIHGNLRVTWFKERSNGRWRGVSGQEGVETIQSGLHFTKVRDAHNGKYMCKITDSTNCSKNATASVTVYRHVWEVCGTTPLIASQGRKRRDSEVEERARQGSEVTRGSVPWQVSIQHNIDGHICGGVVLNQYWVITAAHCFFASQKGKRPQIYQHNTLLKFGKHAILDRSGSKVITPHEEHEQVGHIHKRILHPSFRKNSTKFDIALVKLRSPLQFSDYVRPICLPLGEPELTGRRTGKVTGWGSQEYSMQLSETLQEIFVDIPDQQDQCIREQDSRNSMFCAGDGTVGSAEPCKGDDGGPFAVAVNKEGRDKWYLTGVVSTGPDCSKSNSAAKGIYTNVTAALGWILREMSDPRK